MGEAVWIFAASVALYSSVPLLAALRPGRLRFVLFYAYIAILLALGSLLSAIYSIPVVGDIEVPAGQLTYVGFVFATLVATIVGREVRVIRNVVVLIISVNAVLFIAFAIGSRALNDVTVNNPFATSPDVFEQQLYPVIVGGVLSVMELLLLFWIVETAKRRASSMQMIPVYIGAFVFVLLLDGALFGSLTRLPDGEFLDVMWAGVQIKAVLAAAFVVPLAVFLVVFRPTLARFERTVLEWPIPYFSSQGTLRSTPGWRRPSDEPDLRGGETDTDDVRRALSRIDGSQATVHVLGELSTVLAELPGVRAGLTSLSVLVDDGVVSRFGSPLDPVAPPGLPAQAAHGRVWCDEPRDGIDPAAHIPILLDDAAVGLLDVPLESGRHRDAHHYLEPVAMHVTSLLAPSLRSTRDHWSLQAPIIDIIEHRALDIVFQPIVDLATRSIVSVEALSRFHDGSNPADRFSEADRAGLTRELELLAMEQAILAADPLPSRLPIALNLCPSVVLDERTSALLSRTDHPITLEITEHHLVDDYGALREWVDQRTDVKIAVDDAGSGYATLSHVLEIEPDSIKIDREWVSGLHLDRRRQVLVAGLKALADEIGANVIAEGIEVDAEVAILEDLGIRLGQGFLLGRPTAALNITHA